MEVIRIYPKTKKKLDKKKKVLEEELGVRISYPQMIDILASKRITMKKGKKKAKIYEIGFF